MDILCKSGVKVDKFTVIVDISKFVGFIHIYTSLSTSPVNIPSYEQLYQQYVDNFIHDLFITYIWIIFNSIIVTMINRFFIGKTYLKRALNDIFWT